MILEGESYSMTIASFHLKLLLLQLEVCTFSLFQTFSIIHHFNNISVLLVQLLDWFCSIIRIDLTAANKGLKKYSSNTLSLHLFINPLVVYF